MRRLGILVTLMLACACGDQGPLTEPGTVTVRLVSPHGAEGGAVVVLMGDGFGEVTGLAGTAAFSFRDATSTRVVLIDQDGGELAFSIAVTDPSRPFEGAVLEVAGPDDALRALSPPYRLEISR